MNRDVSRLLHLLAALDLPKSELVQLIHEFRHMSAHEVAARVASLRSRMNFEPASYVDDYRISPRRSLGTSVAEIGERVERLMREDAQLSTADAVDELSMLLIQQGKVSPEQIPPLSRKSFRDWVNRLSSSVSEKDILRSATLIRNSYVHSPEADWKLRK